MRLILCGGGHVSLELAWIASRLDFEVCVLDDRPDFATPERFPMAKQVLSTTFPEGLTRLGAQPSDFFCVLSRNHTCDIQCLDSILKTHPSFAFLGMIGSRRKIGVVMDTLRSRGFSQNLLDRIQAPIGLMLGGETPAEVAVEIAAQLVQVRSRLGPALLPPPADPGVLCVITKTTGSTPRSPGTWMLVRPDGSSIGTVGGGAVEFHAQQDARDFWQNGTPEADRTYDVGDPEMMEAAYNGRVSVHFSRQMG